MRALRGRRAQSRYYRKASVLCTLLGTGLRAVIHTSQGQGCTAPRMTFLLPVCSRSQASYGPLRRRCAASSEARGWLVRDTEGSIDEPKEVYFPTQRGPTCSRPQGGKSILTVSFPLGSSSSTTPRQTLGSKPSWRHPLHLKHWYAFMRCHAVPSVGQW